MEVYTGPKGIKKINTTAIFLLLLNIKGMGGGHGFT